MVIVIFLLGLWFGLTGILRVCGSVLFLNSRRKNLLPDDEKRKRRYLLIQGCCLVLCGLLWIILSLLHAHLADVTFWTVYLLSAGVAIVISLMNNRTSLGIWV